MSLGGALVGGFLGTLVLSTALAGASELGLTRIDIPFLLGTAVTSNRRRAKVIGYGLHFVFGLLFSLVYWVVFRAVDGAGVVLGGALGLLHALFVGTVVVNVLLPAVHPRMGTPYSAADEAPLLESPGFLLLNYGRGTPVVTVLAHIAYGAIVGALTVAAR